MVGQTPAAATKLIEDAGLTVGTVTEQASPADQEGLVTASTPAAGALADPDTDVDLVVGSGPGAVAIPGVVGLDVEQAQSNLGSAGFTRITIDRVDSAQPEGEVISVDPEAGSEVPLDTAITLEVSDGDVAVPDVARSGPGDRDQGPPRRGLQQHHAGDGGCSRGGGHGPRDQPRRGLAGLGGHRDHPAGVRWPG